MATPSYQNYPNSEENQFMQLSDLTDFERDNQRPQNDTELGYEPISFDENDYQESSASFNTEEYLPEGNNIQMAIDDYIDPDQPIQISNKQRNHMQNVYELLKKQKEEERASIGLGKPPRSSSGNRPSSKTKIRRKPSAKSKHLYIPRHRKKKRPYIKSTDRHIDEGGWNFDTRTTGQFDNIQKNELNREKIIKKNRKADWGIKQKKGEKSIKTNFENLQFRKQDSASDIDPNALYFTDMNQIHKYLEEVDDKNLKLEAKNGILKMKDLEKALEEEKAKRKVSNWYILTFIGR